VYADVPVQQRPSWQAYSTQTPFHISDWNADERVPAGLKQGLAAKGMEIGPLIFVPLTTPQRRLGALGMSGAPRTVYSPDDISFLQLVGRVVAFAIDDNFNLRQAETAQAELQRQNDRLRQSERELREVIERIPGMAWTGAPDGSSTFVNRRWSEYTGLSLEDTAGSGWQTAVHPDDLERTIERWQVSVRSGEPFEFEVRFRRAADGQHRWFLVRGVPLRDEHGQVLKWYGIATDMEDHKRAEEALGVHNNRLQLLLNLTTRITSNLDLREVLRAIAANIREVMHADAVTVSVPDPTSGKYRVFAVDFPQGKGVIKEELLLPLSSEAKRAMDTLKPIVFDPRERDEHPPEPYDVAAAEGLKAVCSIPLVDRGRALGILSILRTEPIPFIPEDVDFLSRASGEIAIAIENALAFQEISELVEERKRAEQVLAIQNTRLQLLLELSQRITSNLEPREVLRSVSLATREIMRADAAGVAFFDEASDRARIYAVDFPNAKGFVKEEIVVTPGLAFRRAWESSKPVVLNTNDREELGPEIYGLVIAEGLNGHCLIPLVSRDRIVGVLIVASKLRGSFTPEHVDFLSRASGQIAIAIENALAFREISELKDKLTQEKVYLEEEFRSEMGFEQIIGKSAALKHALQLVETVAPSDSTVVLLGETGTGKELIARAIHDRSRRKQRTFVKLNCAAIPTGLVESELFGHEKGAFTGAITSKIGRLELADQGTLFLDEVGDIPMEIQPKLLRVLQEREFERLGSTHTRKVNVRLVAATNRDLEKMVTDKEFRSDLYYRLNVFPIRIPPLRDRREDIPLLVNYFVQRFSEEMQKRIEAVPVAVMRGLTTWDWPGNIRELENFIERAVLLTRGKSLEAPLSDLRKTNTEESQPANLHEAKPAAEERTNSLSEKSSVADEYERKQRDEIIRALTACKGRVGGADGAAAHLGMNRTTLLSRMKKFGIYPKQYA
jgi:formate hydrogenlyase transcriptional activator